MPIKFEEFEKATQLIKPFIKTTTLEHYRDNIFLKRESEQITGSFKWRGVLFSVMNAFEELRNILINNIVNYQAIILSIAISIIYFIAGILVFYFAYFGAKKRGTLINMGE